MPKKIIGAALGTCVHVSGLHHFFRLAEANGYETLSLGAAVSPQNLVEAIQKHQPDIVAVSYRLTAEVAAGLFEEMKKLITEHDLTPVRFVFGGTAPVARIAEESGLFERAFSGTESPEEIKAYLTDARGMKSTETFAQALVSRIQQKYPYPLIRHHFGRPSLQETIQGVAQIADSGVVDVISLGPDQNAQEHFFRPEQMDATHEGAGGVPVRKPEDLESLYAASRRGNYPLMRCYSGTRDLIKWAEMSVKTIHNAWGAIPLCWYSVMDGRSQRLLRDAIQENQQTMRWYARRGIPLEVNEAHQWSLRDAHDSLAVAMAFLAAYNGKKAGAHHYVAQYMFNTPPGTSPQMDLAKMLAKKELISSLEDSDFTAYTEVRAGIAHFSPIFSVAKGQLAASTLLSLSLRPHILHVVSFSEGDHATYPDELIESCNISHGVLHNCLHGLPDMVSDKNVQKRKGELLSEAETLLDAIRQIGSGLSDDPWSDAKILTKAIEMGILDTPHFQGNPHLCGQITTRLIDGTWHAIDPESGHMVSEAERTRNIFRLA